MDCVCYVCSKQYRIKALFADHGTSHGLCEKCFPGELLRMKRGGAFRASLERHSFSEGNRHLPKGFSTRDLPSRRGRRECESF